MTCTIGRTYHIRSCLWQLKFVLLESEIIIKEDETAFKSEPLELKNQKYDLTESSFWAIKDMDIMWAYCLYSDDSLIWALIVRTKSVGTHFHVRTNGRFSNPEN